MLLYAFENIILRNVHKLHQSQRHHGPKIWSRALGWAGHFLCSPHAGLGLLLTFLHGFSHPCSHLSLGHSHRHTLPCDSLLNQWFLYPSGNVYKFQTGSRFHAILWHKHLDDACKSNRPQVKSPKSSLSLLKHRLLPSVTACQLRPQAPSLDEPFPMIQQGTACSASN